MPFPCWVTPITSFGYVDGKLSNPNGSLCSSQTPVTTLLFGDELQSQLTARFEQQTALATQLFIIAPNLPPNLYIARNRTNLGKGHLKPVQVETTENLEEKVRDQQKVRNTADHIMPKLLMLQVTQFDEFIPSLIAYLFAQTSCFESNLFVAGKNHLRHWDSSNGVRAIPWTWN